MSDDAASGEINFGDVISPSAVDKESAVRIVLAHIDGDPRRCWTALNDVCQRGVPSALAGAYGDPERHGGEAAGIEAERLMPARPRVHTRQHDHR